jgi:hypothetical protein
MKEHQEDFKNTYEGSELTIRGFHRYQDINDHEEVAKCVEELN